MTRRLIDLSHEVEAGMLTYPGLPSPVITDYLSRAESPARYDGKAEFQIGRIDMVANTGTYVDAPFHRLENGTDVGQLPLSSLAFLPGRIVDPPPGERALTRDMLRGIDLGGCALVIRTGWARHWRSEHYGAPEHPFVTREAAEHLVEAGVALVGIDSVNIDDMADPSRPAHSALLRAGIPIVEHLTNLEAIGNRPFLFFAVPPRVRGMGTFTVRAFAALEEETHEPYSSYAVE